MSILLQRNQKNQCTSQLYEKFFFRVHKRPRPKASRKNHQVPTLINFIIKIFSSGSYLTIFFWTLLDADAYGHEKKINPAIYPSLTLEVKLKIYTDNSQIINAFNNGEKIYFGFDLLVENFDRGDTNYENFKTDIMICILSKTDVGCHDYIYYKQQNEYKINDGGSHLLNNLIPLGFSNVDLNFIQENVIGYKSYFSVKFEKEYPPLFDNITMFNWINYVASDTGDGVIGFYGIVGNSIDIIKNITGGPTNNIPLYYERHDFVDGCGLEEDISDFLKNKLFNIFLIIFMTIIII